MKRRILLTMILLLLLALPHRWTVMCPVRQLCIRHLAERAIVKDEITERIAHTPSDVRELKPRGVDVREADIAHGLDESIR